MAGHLGDAPGGRVAGGTLHRVKKTSLYLEAGVDAALARRAARTGVTKAQLIRQVLSEALVSDPSPKPEAVAIWHGGPPDLAEDVDRHLEGFGEA